MIGIGTREYQRLTPGPFAPFLPEKLAMSELLVRRLMIDLEQPFARRWNGGDAFRSAWLNALSMGFPVGEQFFIDSVRTAVANLPDDERAAFADEIKGFIGQEASHRHLHALYNAELARQGFVNSHEQRTVARLKRLERMKVDPRHAVAITAATEHFTAIFAEWMLSHPGALAGADPRLKLLWLWHSAEESEHRCTAFDVYRAAGGNEKWRLFWFRYVSFQFSIEMLRQTMRNLWHDRALLDWRTWASAATLMLGQGGLIRHAFKPWRAYFSADFHPSQQGSQRSADWLRDHADQFRVVGRLAA
jgi:predicted metal-dependent hydrolase